MANFHMKMTKRNDLRKIKIFNVLYKMVKNIQWFLVPGKKG
jgi:hypothetical protein